MLTLQLAVTEALLFRHRLMTRDGERGASLVEYAFLIGLIAVVSIGAVTFFGGSTSAKFSNNASAFP